jgi:hypothetical protein
MTVYRSFVVENTLVVIDDCLSHSQNLALKQWMSLSVEEGHFALDSILLPVFVTQLGI